MFYYGYNAYDSQKDSSSDWGHNNKLHASEWTADIGTLNKYLDNVSASGGSSHEAIEVGLHHLTKCNE